MNVTRLGNGGEKWELLVKQGDDFGPFIATMVNPDNTPVDLTGCQIVGGVKKSTTDTAYTTTFTALIVNAVGGVYSFGLPNAKTAAAILPAGPHENDIASLYLADLKLIDSAGRKQTLYDGPMRVKASVTP